VEGDQKGLPLNRNTSNFTGKRTVPCLVRDTHEKKETLRQQLKGSTSDTKFAAKVRTPNKGRGEDITSTGRGNRKRLKSNKRHYQDKEGPYEPAAENPRELLLVGKREMAFHRNKEKKNSH